MRIASRIRRNGLGVVAAALTLALLPVSTSADVLTKNDRPQSCYPPVTASEEALSPVSPGAPSGAMRLCLTAVAAARLGQPLAMRLTLENVSTSARRIERYPTETRLRFQIADAHGRILKSWFYPIRTTIPGNLRFGPGQKIPLSFDFAAIWRGAPQGTYTVQACWRLSDFNVDHPLDPCSNVVTIRIVE